MPRCLSHWKPYPLLAPYNFSQSRAKRYVEVVSERVIDGSSDDWGEETYLHRRSSLVGEALATSVRHVYVDGIGLS